MEIKNQDIDKRESRKINTLPIEVSDQYNINIKELDDFLNDLNDFKIKWGG